MLALLVLAALLPLEAGALREPADRPAISSAPSGPRRSGRSHLGTQTPKRGLVTPRPAIPHWPYPREKGTYQAKLAGSGRILWEVSWEATVTPESGRRWVEVTEEGHGQPFVYKEPIRWEKRMAFQGDPSFKIHSMSGSRWSAKGKWLNRLGLRVDSARQRVFYEDASGLDPTQESVTLALDPKLLPDDLLFHWARTLTFDRDPAGECQLLVSPNRRFHLKAWVRSTETVTTPAGTFRCYRVELVPQLGPLGLTPLRWLIPPLTLWCRAEPPHVWVKYRGPAGPPGSPQVAIELASFEPSS